MKRLELGMERLSHGARGCFLVKRNGYGGGSLFWSREMSTMGPRVVVHVSPIARVTHLRHLVLTSHVRLRSLNIRLLRIFWNDCP